MKKNGGRKKGEEKVFQELGPFQERRSLVAWEKEKRTNLALSVPKAILGPKERTERGMNKN